MTSKADWIDSKIQKLEAQLKDMQAQLKWLKELREEALREEDDTGSASVVVNTSGSGCVSIIDGALTIDATVGGLRGLGPTEAVLRFVAMARTCSEQVAVNALKGLIRSKSESKHRVLHSTISNLIESELLERNGNRNIALSDSGRAALEKFDH